MRRATGRRNRRGYVARRTNSARALPNSTAFRDTAADSDADDAEEDYDVANDNVCFEEDDEDNDGSVDKEDQEQTSKSNDADVEGVDLEYNNDNGPLEQWGNNCKAKLAIISELKNESSSIHDFIPDGEFSCNTYKDVIMISNLIFNNRSY